MKIVLELNSILPLKVGYTFDAGPHAILFIHSSVFAKVFKALVEILSIDCSRMNIRAVNHSKEQSDMASEDIQ